MIDPVSVTAMIGVISSAVDLVDKVASPIMNYLSNQKVTEPKDYDYKVQGQGNQIVVKDGDRQVQVIKGEDLQNLPAEYYQHIQVLEQSMKRKYNLWKRVYPQLDSSADPMVNAKVHEQVNEVILSMKGDLEGIIDFLMSIGVQLDDHYIIFRNTISQLDSS